VIPEILLKDTLAKVAEGHPINRIVAGRGPARGDLTTNGNFLIHLVGFGIAVLKPSD